jgi:hypothetical protein
MQGLRTQEEQPPGANSRSDILTNFHLHVSPQRGQTDASNAIVRTRQRCPNPSLSNFNKATKDIGGIREEKQKGEHQTLQDLDPNKFPHKEVILIGQSVDLDLL